jgi:hypothetical protein
MLAYTAHVRYYLLPPTCIHFCGASETAAAERQTLCERLRQTSKWGPPSKRRKDALNLLLQGCALSCEKIHKAKRRSQRMQPAIKRRWHDSWDSRRIMERHKVEARPNINSQTIPSKKIACILLTEADFWLSPLRTLSSFYPPENKPTLPTLRYSTKRIGNISTT